MDYGKIGGTSPNAGKKAAKYRCPHPVTGEPHFKKAFKRDDMKRPVALWYQQRETWYLNTVVDLDDMPDWSKNYTQGEAELVSEAAYRPRAKHTARSSARPTQLSQGATACRRWSPAARTASPTARLTTKLTLYGYVEHRQRARTGATSPLVTLGARRSTATDAGKNGVRRFGAKPRK
jgi:hypothetical protein